MEADTGEGSCCGGEWSSVIADAGKGICCGGAWYPVGADLDACEGSCCEGAWSPVRVDQTSQLSLFHSETQGFWSILKVSLSYPQISL